MGRRFRLLQRLHSDVQAGAPLAGDARSCAALLDPCAPPRAPRETALLQLRVLGLMLGGGGYGDVLAALRGAGVDAKLIRLLCGPDPLLSHAASRALAALVRRQLTEQGTLNGAWLSFCLTTLSGLPRSSHAAECLWTLTSLVRGLLAGGGSWGRLLAPLDSALEGLHMSVLLQPDVLRDAPAPAEVTRTLSSFLDLLELLVASRAQAPLDSACQAMLLRAASGVLRLTTLPAHGFLRKKAILLLKRGLLQTAGEGGRARPASCQHPPVERESLALADTVLQFVDSGGLNRVAVDGRGGHFGGHQDRPDGAAHGGSDQVTLRAVSLVLLKALEIKTQHLASGAEAQVRVESVLRPLLTFVETRLGVRPFEHRCRWLSVLFIEQDDDMLEAAKALLAIYVQCESSLDDGNWDPLAHRRGCNPHCVFLFLLSSIAFDVSVLLDFLISSETCFLEYFVRYLKLLIRDWHHVVEISERFQPWPTRSLSFPLEHLSGQEHPSSQPGSSLRTASPPLQRTPKDAKPSSPEVWSGPEPALGALQRLAEYESSEEDSEGAGEERLAGVKPASLGQACTATTVDAGDHAQSMAQQASLPGQDDVALSSPSSCSVPLSSPGSGEGILEKAVQCLQGLRDSVSRLHEKSLFPYNPAALLRLLAHVDRLSRPSRSAWKQSESRTCRSGSPFNPTH